MSPKSGQNIGPFQLAEIIGVGGMGEVWKAHHRRNGTAVAVKVITSARASEPRYLDSFMREVQAVAGLNHPGVVAIYDFGELKGPKSTIPWYAMELAETSLAEVQLGDWPTLQRVLIEMLDALAHAHARGIIHRDLKPENVLLGDLHAMKLTDFGMAHVAEYVDDTGNVFGPGGGTPDFMAPEQFRGQWRRFGPWTDLYALGCVAWELATGHAPFPGDSVIEIAMSHMSGQPPPLQALFDVPPRFEVWLRRLTQKHPLDRYRRAADAQWALVHDVGADDRHHEARPRSRPGVPSDLDFADTGELRAPQHRDTLDDVGSTMAITYAFTPPFPATWRTDHRPARIDGVGLGLFGIREIPFVGREGAREYLWDRLRAVDESGLNEVIFVYGDSGIGRTRFGQWISRRADELGAATIVKATHSPITHRTNGVAGAMMRFLGIEGVDVARATEIVGHRIGPAFDPSLIFELLYSRKTDDSLGTSNFAAPTQRYGAVERLFKQLSFERPVIFFVDDVQWGADTLLFVQHLMSRKTRTLIVANVRNDAVVDRFWESQLLSETELSANASTIHLQPLTNGEQRDLMDQMLDLEPSLAARVMERTQGIPLFATQLVGDWIQRAVLEEGPQGFRLSDGATIKLPDDVYSMWNHRIDELSASLESTDVRAVLEVAALLGRGALSELEAVCTQLGVVIPPQFEQQLVSRRLALRDLSGWTFQHGMLRETLERSAVESGRAVEIYSAAGQATDDGDPYRAAEFQIRAGELDLAIHNLLTAIDAGILSMAVDQSQQLIDMIADLLDQIAAPADDPRRGRLFAASVEVLRLGGDVPEALARAAALVDEAMIHGWRREAGYGHIHLGVLLSMTGTADDEVLRHFDEALAIFHEIDDDAGRAHGYRALAGFHLGAANAVAAGKLIIKAHRIVERLGDVDGMIECLLALGSARFAARALGEARESFENARETAGRHEMRLLVAAAHDGLGQVEEAEGALEAAEANYRRAQSIWAATGSQTAHVAGVHLALLLLREERFDPAREALLQTREVVLSGTLPQVAQVVDAGLMVCAAVDADAALFDELNRELRALLRTTPAPDMRVPQTTFVAGQKWAAHGDRTRARKAYDIARNVFLGLGEQKSADEVAFAIGRL